MVVRVPMAHAVPKANDQISNAWMRADEKREWLDEISVRSARSTMNTPVT